MALSTGAKSMIGEAMSWTAVASLAACAFLNYDQIKSVVSSHLHVDLRTVATAPVGVPSRPKPSGSTVELAVNSRGHYGTRADINGRPVNVMVDTGATLVALTWDDAQAAGLFLRPADFTQAAATANGVARIAPVVLDRISIGNITVRNVPAAVAEPGRLPVTLLGMSFLNRLERVDMRNGTLILRQ